MPINAIWEAEQLEDFAAICRTHDVDCFLDIGANAGVYSVMLATKDLGGEIIAFEPDPGNRARLLANIAANGLQQQNSGGGGCGRRQGGRGRADGSRAPQSRRVLDRASRQAAGGSAGRCNAMWCGRSASTTSSRSRGKTILVKMDVEGSEFHALAGMERTLRDNLCYLQVELYSDRFEELKALFARLGYRYLKTNYIDHYFTNMPERDLTSRPRARQVRHRCAERIRVFCVLKVAAGNKAPMRGVLPANREL